MEPKYLVFKTEEYDAMMEKDLDPRHLALDDAVVIRRQDVFAPPALDCYANAITVTIEGMKITDKGATSENYDVRQRLQNIADYFHDQAAKSWTEQRKLPD
jgi:hypothetical protein